MRGVEQIPWLYDLYMAGIDRIGFGRWRRWVVAGARGRTLEVGCGTGRNLPLYEAPQRVIGLELDLRLLRSARLRAPRVALVVASAEAMPFRDDVFDTVVASLVFCSVDDPHGGLAEVRRVLRRESGRLRMLEHVRARSRPLAALQDLAQPAWTRITGGCRPNRDTERTVAAAGFEIEHDGRARRGSMRRFSARPAG